MCTVLLGCFDLLERSPVCSIHYLLSSLAILPSNTTPHHSHAACIQHSVPCMDSPVFSETVLGVHWMTMDGSERGVVLDVRRIARVDCLCLDCLNLAAIPLRAGFASATCAIPFLQAGRQLSLPSSTTPQVIELLLPSPIPARNGRNSPSTSQRHAGAEGKGREDWRAAGRAIQEQRVHQVEHHTRSTLIDVDRAIPSNHGRVTSLQGGPLSRLFYSPRWL